MSDPSSGYESASQPDRIFCTHNVDMEYVVDAFRTDADAILDIALHEMTERRRVPVNPKGYVELDPNTAFVESEFCAGCGLCAPACPEGAIQQHLFHSHDYRRTRVEGALQNA